MSEEEAKAAATVDAMLKGEYGVTVDDFVAYMPAHSYICTLTREPWPGVSVNARVGPVKVGEEPVLDKEGKPALDKDGKPATIPIFMKASEWLDQNRPVEQMTWAPGEPMLISGRLVANGGWIHRQGVTCFNLYRPPVEQEGGDPDQADRWSEHIYRLYGKEDGWHIIRYFAFKVQRPDVKINHGLVLGGDQGIGKDTICAPLKYAVGPWNFIEISPKHIAGRFNGYAKSVMLRVSEARDLGEVNRFDFYEQLKVLTASPPEVLRVDEKHLREYDVFNVCGVIITTNYKTNGIYLPTDDRRHFVAWSTAKKEDFSDEYWNGIWKWYEASGYAHVTAYLQTLDVADFNPKAPPPKTAAFWDIVNANHAPEEAELADIIDRLSKPHTKLSGEAVTTEDGMPVLVPPEVITLDMIEKEAENTEIGFWIKDRKNRRAIPHRLEKCGYEPVRNDDAKSDGHWKIGGKRQAVYAHTSLTIKERIEAVRRLQRSR
jgi:hypothetical protein